MNNGMGNMAGMGGPVGAPMPMMNNGAMPQQNPRQMQVNNNDTRVTLNTYIYEYFLRSGMYDCARALLMNSEGQVLVKKESPGRRDENGKPLNGLGDDSMDTDSKDDLESKRPDDLPAPNVPSPYPDSCFLFEWFCIFWDMLHAQKGKGAPNTSVNSYVQHTQQNQLRMRQLEQQQLANMRPNNHLPHQYNQRMMQNVNGAMLNLKPGNLQRTAMANNQHPNIQMLQQKAGMQGNPADMDGNRQRPGSPGSTENAPSPSKRPRLEGPAFNQGMMPNGRPVQGMPGQNQVGSPGAAFFLRGGPDRQRLNHQQALASPHQAKTIANYAANLQQHHGSQMPNKPMANSIPPGQASPMMPQQPENMNAFYTPGDMNPANMRPGPGNGQVGGGGGGGNSNHALQDYQMQLMLLEQQNKKRLMMARQEADPRGEGMGGPGGPPGGPGSQPFQGASPPGGRNGASPNPDPKRSNQQMTAAANMGSPLPEGAQNRSSPGQMSFISAQMNPNAAPHFFNGNMEKGMEMNMAGAQMNAQMRPPSSHPSQAFNGHQMTPQQQMMAARQAGQQGGPPMQQWQSPNGPMGPQGSQPQMAGTPSQRAMPPPSAPAAGANNRNTASPQTATAAPPTPQQANKAAPKKKESKNAKNSKGAAQKKNITSGATPVADTTAEPEPPAPATPITPVPTAGFNNKGPAPGGQGLPNGQSNVPAPAPAPVQPHQETNQSNFMDNSAGMEFANMDFANPALSDNVLNDFDFDSFLHESGGADDAFDFPSYLGEGGEIGAD